MEFDLSDVLKLLDAITHLDEDEAWFFAIDEGLKQKIIEMNTIDQLYQDGILSDGSPTGEYAESWQIKKKKKSQIFDHVTLKDTGDFYKTWVVTVDSGGFTIDADGDVSKDTDLFMIYGDEVVGLTEKNKEIIIELITGKYIEYINHKLNL